MNNDNETNEIISILENKADCSTAFRVISLIKRQRSEVSQIRVQLVRCQDIIASKEKTIAKQVKLLDRRRV